MKKTNKKWELYKDAKCGWLVLSTTFFGINFENFQTKKDAEKLMNFLNESDGEVSPS